MSTRSFIGRVNDDDTVTAIYCHYDGYPSGVGSVLFHHYAAEDLDKLFALGDLSVLGREPKTSGDFDKHLPNGCVAYKDRGEDCPAKTYTRHEFLRAADCCGADFMYLFEGNIWYIARVYSDTTFDDFHVLCAEDVLC